MSEVFSLFGAQQGINQTNALLEKLDNLTSQFARFIERLPEPFNFIESRTNLSSNVNEDVMICPGNPVPTGHRASVEDFNINFSTVAGTVKVAKMDASRNKITDILKGINSDTSGIGKTVLYEGQSLAILGETAGAGVFTVDCSGIKQKVN